MELRHLRYFSAVAEQQSFSRAALRLHLSQPSLTRQIKNLEEEIGVQLIDRSRNPISLTRAGQSFLEDAKRVLAMTDASIRAVRCQQDESARQLNIGYLPNFSNHVLPATLYAFRQAYPLISLNLFEMTRAEQFDALLHHKIDLGFVGLEGLIKEAGLKSERVAQYQVHVALSRFNPLAKKTAISFRDLATVFFVSFSEEIYPGWHQWLQHLFPVADFSPLVVQDVRHVPAMMNFVSANLGVAILSEPIRHFRNEGIVLRPLRPSLSAVSCIAWKDDNSSYLLREYIRVVQDLSA